MRLMFFTAGGRTIGFGHLRRCMSLAAAAGARGLGSNFVLHACDDKTRRWLVGQGHSCEQLSLSDSGHLPALCARSGCSQVVVDSYEVDAGHVTPWLDEGLQVLVIDDIAGRPLAATWLTNSAVLPDESPYSGVTGATLLLGPAYALLRREFSSCTRDSAQAGAGRIVVTFGGSDPLDLTPATLSLLNRVPEPLEITAVVGPLADNLQTCERIARTSKHAVKLISDVKDMASLLARADLAVTAGGQTLFELAATGCPAVAVQIADNQNVTLRLFEKIGSIVAVRVPAELDALLGGIVSGLLQDPDRRTRMGQAGRKHVDGRGADRVIDVLLKA